MPRRRIPGEFVPSDIRTQFDPSIMRAGPMAELLFRRGNEYSKANGRDGDLLKLDLPVVAAGIAQPAKHVKALEANGLWEPIDGGWRIRSWKKWNLTEAEQAEARADKTTAAHQSNHAQGRHAETPVAECPDCQKEAA